VTVRAGVTLVELMVVLVILSVMAAVTGIAVHRTPALRAVDVRVAAVAAARRTAIDSGRTITVIVEGDSAPVPVTVGPDGSVIADASLGVDRLTGVAALDTTRSRRHAP
jgi:prepilin-type N-terminal cleavage/methylation domain-containing protein